MSGKISLSELNKTKVNETLKKESKNKVDNIFLMKKFKRNGLLEKKTIKKTGKVITGRWTKEEHIRFISACYKFGANWKKIQESIITRTTAQIRSHAQKYVIKICKKYNIEIKSRRKIKFISEHLNFPYRRKGNIKALSLEKMTDSEKSFIINFNFYDKNFDLDLLKENKTNINIFPKNTIFKIFKIPNTKKNFKDEIKHESSFENIDEMINNNNESQQIIEDLNNDENNLKLINSKETLSSDDLPPKFVFEELPAKENIFVKIKDFENNLPDLKLMKLLNDLLIVNALAIKE